MPTVEQHEVVVAGAGLSAARRLTSDAMTVETWISPARLAGRARRRRSRAAGAGDLQRAQRHVSNRRGNQAVDVPRVSWAVLSGGLSDVPKRGRQTYEFSSWSSGYA